MGFCYPITCVSESDMTSVTDSCSLAHLAHDVVFMMFNALFSRIYIYAEANGAHHLNWSFSTKEPYNQWLICGKSCMPISLTMSFL